MRLRPSPNAFNLLQIARLCASSAGWAASARTTLATLCAQRVAERYPDGQLYIDLRGFGDAAVPAAPGDVLRSFISAFGVDPKTLPVELEDRAALFRSLVATRRVLVFLDNARDSEQVRPLLPGGRGCGGIVTSRDRLDPLAASGAVAVSLDRLDPAASVRLLRTRLGGAATSVRTDRERRSASRRFAVVIRWLFPSSLRGR